MSGFSRKVRRNQAKKAVKSLGALEKMAELTQQLEDVLKVNSTLVEENNKIHEEIGLTLEDHHKDIKKLKKIVAQFVPSDDRIVRFVPFEGEIE